MMEQKVIHNNMNAINNIMFEKVNEVSYDFDEDAFSINSYDSEQMSSMTSNQIASNFHFDEMSEDEEYDEEEIIDEVEQEKEREKERQRIMLDGLSVLEGKLNWTTNWLEKIETPINPTVDPDTFPLLSDNFTEAKGTETRERRDGLKYKPAPHIDVVVGKNNSIRLRCDDKPEVKRRQMCRSIMAGKPCSYGDRCIFSHGEKKDCRFGVDCKNKNCTFKHEAVDDSRAGGQDVQYKKMWLCKNMFRVTADKIEKLNRCRFGQNCIYAHSKEEVRQIVTACKFGEKCKSVHMIYETISTAHGAERGNESQGTRLVRRYVNKPDGKVCLRKHLNERITDYIKRTTTHYKPIDRSAISSATTLTSRTSKSG